MVSVDEQARQDWVQSSLSSLRDGVLDQNSIASTDGLLASHILADHPFFLVDWEVYCNDKWLANEYDATSAHHVAALGYSYAATKDSSLKAALEAGLERLQSRDSQSGGHLSLSSQPIVLLGLVLGAKAIGDLAADALSWCSRAIQDRARQGDSQYSNEPLYQYLRYCIDGSKLEFPPLNDCDLYYLSFLEWSVKNDYSERPSDALRQRLRETLVSRVAQDPQIQSAHQAALVWDALYGATLHEIVASQPAQVSRMLSGIQDGLRRWRWDDSSLAKPIRWPIRTEREVQDIVYLVLSAVFADLVDEDTLPKFGHSSYAADFGIPTLALLIEVKFARRAGDFKKIEKEVMEDAVPYLSNNTRYNRMIVFVYDHSSSIQEHSLTRRALMSVNGIEDVVFVCRPSQLPEQQ